MRDELLHYFERELTFIRRGVSDFADRYPEVASRMMIEENRCEDPHVERLIEAFAMLAARIQMRLSDDFSDISEALLSVLYPHYLCPIPSMTIVQMNANTGQLPAKGLQIERKAELYSKLVKGVRCRFRTTYPVTLWPIEVESVELVTTTGLDGVVPNSARSALRISLRSQGEASFADMGLDHLRFYLDAESGVLHRLHELFLRDSQGLALRSAENGAVTVLPPDSIRPMGFGRNEGALEYPDESFLGYRLLQEYFAFPDKFMFVELANLDRHAGRMSGDKLDIFVLLSESVGNLDIRVEKNNLKLGCVPAINLFKHQADPIRMTHTSIEYPVVPDVRQPDSFEVYSITDVSSTSMGSTESVKYDPIYRMRHAGKEGEANAFWSLTRRQSIRKGDNGTDVSISLVDENLNPLIPPTEVLHLEILASNRELPSRLSFGDPNGDFEIAGYPAIKSICCLRSPSASLPPPVGSGARWRIISHLALNHLSLTGDDDEDEDRAVNALREILKLYDFSDSPVTRQRISGLTGLKSRRTVRRVGRGADSGFARGVEVELTFDASQYTGAGVFVFASVLEAFLGLYCSVNSFNQTVARITRREGVFKRWSPRMGEKQLL
ncbi:MAG: type VI secretion system baseplate subunit TssF [Myxococcales bacterium]|nr:type VI secretion system baseplate subunit TssF [Myxococcales bacterium]